MKIGFAQVNPRVGDIPFNLEKIKEKANEGISKGLRLIVFPELALTGYPLRDLLDYEAIVNANLKALEALTPLSQKIAILCGYVDKNPLSTGKPYTNCAALLDKGKVSLKYQKQLLPYYDVFEEERFFEAGNEPGIFTLDGKKFGITICEDIWNSGEFLARPYTSKPLLQYSNLDLDLLLNLSASPFHLGKPETRLALAREITHEIRCPLLFCNQVGANDELIFDGSSFFMLPNGTVTAHLPSFETAFGLVDLQTKTNTPFHLPSHSSEWLEKALTLGIRDYVSKSKNSKVCLGISGGIDSAVVAYLAVLALGKDNVFGLSMPSRYSSQESQQDAKSIALELGIDFGIVSIDRVYQQAITELTGHFGKLNPDTLENIQPRLRMLNLMALSSEKGALLLNTSNKSEISMGFATLYGDTAGALSVIGDLKKHEVYALGKYLNEKKKVIPDSVFERAPTAELKENQKDQDVLPPYDELDALVASVIEERETTPNETFRKMHSVSEFKRHQFPPILRVTEKAFGMGRRMPIAARLESIF